MDVTLPENPRGKEIFLMHTRSIQTEAVHQELLKTLRTAWTAKRAGAKKVTLVMPYLVYSRSDRKVVGFSDLGIATMARLMKAAGVDQIVTTSVHQPQEVGIFEALDMRVVHLSGERILAQRTAQRLKEHAGKLSVVAKGATNEATARAMAQRLSEAFGVAIPVRVDPNEPGVGEVPVSIGGLAVVAPDAGAAKRAKMFARLLAQNLGLPGKAIDVQVASKERTADGSKTKTTFDGDLTGKIAVIIDDETASGGTLRDIAAAAASKGAVAQIAAVSHLMGDAASTLAKSPHLERLIVTDTVPLMTRRIATGSKVDVAPMGETFGHVMRALDNGRSTHQWSFIEQAAD
jgi:ribose-phosphate pyrophosphokinase